MALIVEDGTGVPEAESYNSIAAISAYWLKRPHTGYAVAWAAADSDTQEGAAREATDYLDATFGALYRGTRKGYVQGRLYPRSGADDGTGYPLPDLPPELVQATSELAGRAVSGLLSPDADLSGAIKSTSVKVGPITDSIEYVPGTKIEKKFGFLEGLLSPILDRAEPGSAASWEWR